MDLPYPSLPIHNVTLLLSISNSALSQTTSSCSLTFTKTQLTIVSTDIAKYFGQSTPDGIQFQFRGFKKDADILRKVESDGGDVANCLNLGSGGGSLVSTPSKPTAARATGSRTGTGTGRKRTRKQPDIIKRASSEEEEDDIADIDNWSEHEDTPTKKPKTGAFPGQRNGTPGRRAAAKANATIAEASALLDASDSQPETDAPVGHFASAFSPVGMPVQPAQGSFNSRPIIGMNTGPPAISYPPSGHYGLQSFQMGDADDMLGDGEILEKKRMMENALCLLSTSTPPRFGIASGRFSF